MNPAIPTSAPVCTNSLVERFCACVSAAAGVGVGVGVSFGVSVGVGVWVGVAVGDIIGVAVGVPGVGVGHDPPVTTIVSMRHPGAAPVVSDPIRKRSLIVCPLTLGPRFATELM